MSANETFDKTSVELELMSKQRPGLHFYSRADKSRIKVELHEKPLAQIYSVDFVESGATITGAKTIPIAETDSDLCSKKVIAKLCALLDLPQTVKPLAFLA